MDQKQIALRKAVTDAENALKKSPREKNHMKNTLNSLAILLGAMSVVLLEVSIRYNNSSAYLVGMIDLCIGALITLRNNKLE